TENGARISSLGKLGLMDLQILRIGGEDTVTDRQLDGVARLRGLIGLNLSDQPRVTDAGLRRLVDLRCLNTLALKGTKISDDGLESVARLPNLMALDVGFTAVGDSGLARIAGMKSLKQIYLGFTRVTDAGLARLEGSEALTVLVLSDTSVSD